MATSGNTQRTITKSKVTPSVATLATSAAALIAKGATNAAAAYAAQAETRKVISKGSTGNIQNTAVQNATKATTTKVSTVKQTQPKAAAQVDIVRWSGSGGVAFYVKPTGIKGVKDINIKVSPETEDAEDTTDKYVTKKANGGLEISMTAILNSMLGVDVESAAKSMLEASRTGATGYFYIAGKKLFTPQFMMTSADAKNIMLTGDGRWASCEVGLTLKQSSKYGGGETGGGSADANAAAAIAAAQAAGRAKGEKQQAEAKAKYQMEQIGKNVASAVSNIAAAASSIKQSIGTTNDAKARSKEVLQNSQRKGTGGGVGSSAAASMK